VTDRGLLIGGPVWGDVYTDIFERYCLATMRSPANLAALQANGATLEIHTDEYSRPRLEAMLKDCGIPSEVVVTSAGGSKYDILGQIHAQQVAACVARNLPFHMLVADQMYSENYFPRMFKLAKEHGNLIHSGVCCKAASARPFLDLFRKPDGSITISASALGRITWNNRHNRLSNFLMNDGEWPNFHMHIWRSRDRAMIFCPHNSPIYLLPETGRALGATHSTLDAMAHMIGDYYAPTFEDDMTLSNIDCTGEIEPSGRVNWERFAERGWQQAKTIKNLEFYYKRPSAEVAIALDEDAPTAADITARQAVIADRMIAFAIEKGWA
jgi:hypothetical protein